MKEFSVAAVFSNHCVLQRNKNILVFGHAGDGSLVKVELIDANGKVIRQNDGVAAAGRWEIVLDAVEAMQNCTLTVYCESEKKVFTDIAIGEVWLAGGQSNMEFELQNCTEGPSELTQTEDPNVRFYYTNKIAWKDEAFYEAEKNTCWQTWDSEWKKAWSAVGYLFAKKLAKELGVTVGVIGCNWGGTSASAWMGQEYLEKDEDLRSYLIEQAEATKGKTIEQQCAEFDDYVKKNDEWQAKCGKMYIENPDTQWNDVIAALGECPWPGPKSCKNPYRPCGLYDTMLHRIIPYSIKGVIWYQGESDDHKPGMYYKLFNSMIQNWRDDWNQQELPFIFVQLPEHRYIQDKDYKNWCLIREAQEKTFRTVKNTFMVCAADVGQYNDIHPKAKKVLSERMTDVALSGVYNTGAKLNKVLSPIVESYICKEDTIIVTLSNAEDGLEYRADEKELKEMQQMEKNQGITVADDFTGFEIAGDDKVYYPATFELQKNKIILKSKDVTKPLYARYAWYNYGPVVLFTKSGLPVAPFRTSVLDSNNQTNNEHAAIQQIMTVNS